jgi:hypothetical protein
MSRIPALLASGALVLAPAAARAQDRPISIYFEPCKEQKLNDAIAAALTQPPFVLQTRFSRDALVVTIPDRIDRDQQPNGAVWTFTVAFHRDGDSLGQSVESCNEHRLTDCTDQLANDAKSAASMGQ